jgi:hypothetical protein
MNPDLVDVSLCSTTGCGLNPPADELLVYPTGNPVVTSVTPSSGPASGVTAVVISGQNLGCAVSVSCGSVVAESFANDPALLDCGTTGLVNATATTGTSSALFHYTGAPGSPVITSDSSATAQVGTFFSFTVTTSGRPPVFLSESGPLPNGLHFRGFGHRGGPGTAVLEGTPAYGSGGIYYFALSATNHAGTAFQAFTLTVNQSPGFSPTRSTDTVLVGEPVTIALVSSGSAGNYQLVVSATSTVATVTEPLSIVVSAGP